MNKLQFDISEHAFNIQYGNKRKYVQQLVLNACTFEFRNHYLYRSSKYMKLVNILNILDMSLKQNEQISI